ncbi:hypothetical protein IAT38_000577 [Cryptococcus sp. DSM 104549]
MSPRSSLHSTPPNRSNDPSPLEFESSDAYLSLLARLSRTESQLSALSAQVGALSDLVRTALPRSTLTPHPQHPQHQQGTLGSSPQKSRPVFSPFDSDPPPLSVNTGGLGVVTSPFMPNPASPAGRTPDATAGGSSAGNDDPAISALTRQISALSTSVAQLQRLQTTQAARQPLQQQQQQQLGSSSLASPPGGGPGDHHPGPLSLGVPRGHTGMDSLMGSSGPMTTPNPPQQGGQTPGQGGQGGQGMGFGPSPTRPGINRSFSSGVVAGGEFQRHGHSHSHSHVGQGGHHQLGLGSGMGGLGAHGGHGGHGGHQSSALGRDWPSPGPGQTPGGGARGGEGRDGMMLTPGGAAVPGGGIVVSKWEHLNLKVDLLRSISKYGIGPPNKIQTRVLPFMIKGSDIIAQAPPTTERIISYVIPALHLCQSLPAPTGPYTGPAVIIVTTTVDQAMQCHKLIRGVGGPIGIRAGIAAGAASSGNLQNEIAQMQREAVHLLVGTPAKVHEVMTARGGLSGSEVRLLILDEVDQLIARNLYENVLNFAKLLPPPRGRGGLTPGGPVPPFSPGLTSPYDAGRDSPFNPASKTPFPNQGSRFGAPGTNTPGPAAQTGAVDRQTCIFSNTIPTDVINFSQSLQVRDPVRVLVRREGGTNSQESVSSVTPGVNLKHTYVYLTITGSAQAGNAAPVESGPGTIGSGRAQGGNGGQMNEEQTRAKEYKLDTLVKMLDDYPLWQAIVHVGSFSMLEAVVYKLQTRKWETLYLTPDMPPSQKKAVLNQWRISLSGNGPRFLVVFDVNVKPPEVPWAPLVINFDLPRSVEGYAQRAAAAVPPTTRQGPQVNGVIVSFVQAAGGDVEMLRSTECAYRFKSAEIPSVFHDLFLS